MLKYKIPQIVTLTRNIRQPPGSGKQIKNRTATAGIFSCAPCAARYFFSVP